MGDAMMATMRAGLSGTSSGASGRRRRFVWPWKRYVGVSMGVDVWVDVCCACECVCVC